MSHLLRRFSRISVYLSEVSKIAQKIWNFTTVRTTKDFATATLTSKAITAYGWFIGMKLVNATFKILRYSVQGVFKLFKVDFKFNENNVVFPIRAPAMLVNGSYWKTFQNVSWFPKDAQLMVNTSTGPWELLKVQKHQSVGGLEVPVQNQTVKHPAWLPNPAWKSRKLSNQKTEICACFATWKNITLKRLPNHQWGLSLRVTRVLIVADSTNAPGDFGAEKQNARF